MLNHFAIKGELLKQGPAPSGQIDGKCDEECLKEESEHWKATHIFRMEPMELSEFQAGMDKRQMNREYTARNLILLRYYEGGYHYVFGRQYEHKLCPDSVTEVIAEKVHITSDAQIYQIVRDRFAYEENGKLTIFERNLLD